MPLDGFSPGKEEELDLRTGKLICPRRAPTLVKVKESFEGMGIHTALLTQPYTHRLVLPHY